MKPTSALAKSKKQVAAKLKKLNLVHAGFGRYNKGKGTPVVRWVMKSPKTGLYILADAKLRAKILGKRLADTVPTIESVKKKAAKTQFQKAHEMSKANLTKLHLARLDKKRAELLAARGKRTDKPLTKREMRKRDASVKKLHKVLDKHFNSAVDR